MTFVCTACRRPVSSRFEQFVERVEYRRVDGGKRVPGPVLRDLCLACVQDLVAKPANRQERLL